MHENRHIFYEWKFGRRKRFSFFDFEFMELSVTTVELQNLILNLILEIKNENIIVIGIVFTLHKLRTP